MSASSKPLAKPEDFDGVTLMHLRVENAMRVKLVDLTFDRTVTTIGGDNEQGKSSLLNALRWIFGGKAVIKEIADDPIHDDRKTATIIADFGRGEKIELTAVGELKRVGDDDFAWSLELIIPGFVAPTRVQEFMTSLIGDAIDPTEFDELPDDEKFETLRKFVGGFDFKENKAERDRVFKERTEVGKDQRREQSAADAIDILDKAPDDREDETALAAELRAVGDHNVEIERRRANRENAVKRVAQLRGECTASVTKCESDEADLRLQIAALEARIVAIREASRLECQSKTKEADELQAKLDAADPLPPAKDAAEIEAKLNAARTVNRAIEDWEAQRARKRNHQTAADDHAKQYEQLTAEIAEIENARADAIAKAHLPVDGLGFGDGVVTLDGKPWRQGSTAGRMVASAFISMAMKPKVRVILMRNASNLGSAIKKRIEEAARAKDYRVLMEVVDESGANSHIFIEDGMVKLIDGKEPPAPQPDPQPEPAAVTDDGPNKLDDEFALSPEPPTKQKPARRQWKGPGAPAGDQSS